MSARDAVRRQAEAVRRTLARRLESTPDPNERAALGRVLAGLERDALRRPRTAGLEAEEALAGLTRRLEQAVRAARQGPFDGHLAALERHYEKLSRLAQTLHERHALPPAPAAGRRARTGRRSARAARAPGAAAAVATVTDYESLKAEYRRLWERCEVRPERAGHVAYYGKRLREHRTAYEPVAAALGIPWQFVGVVHAMECGFSFACHLHNGDPLRERTVRVPKGRPVTGSPPFTWQESAVDALRLQKLHRVEDWTVPRMLYLLERYNGFGYRRRGLPTPYLWSFSNLYEKGKFVRDGAFDPEAVSQQCGAALMLREALDERT